MQEIYASRRKPGEAMDAYIARYTVLAHRAQTIGGVAIHFSHWAWQLMVGAGIQQHQMWQFLLTLNGALPMDEPGYNQVVEQMRRYGHMVEASGHAQQNRYMATGFDGHDDTNNSANFTGDPGIFPATV